MAVTRPNFPLQDLGASYAMVWARVRPVDRMVAWCDLTLWAKSDDSGLVSPSPASGVLTGSRALTRGSGWGTGQVLCACEFA